MGSGCVTKSGSRFKVQGLVAFIAGSDLTADASQKPLLSVEPQQPPTDTGVGSVGSKLVAQV